MSKSNSCPLKRLEAAVETVFLGFILALLYSVTCLTHVLIFFWMVLLSLALFTTDFLQQSPCYPDRPEF